MTDDNLHQIEKIKNRLHAETMMGAIKSSITIADMVTDAISKGANMIIEGKNGENIALSW